MNDFKEPNEQKIGYDGLIDALKKENYEPIGIKQFDQFMMSITAPSRKRNKYGKMTIALMDDVFNNTEDTRQFNKGKIKIFMLAVEDLNFKEKGE